MLEEGITCSNLVERDIYLICEDTGEVVGYSGKYLSIDTLLADVSETRHYRIASRYERITQLSSNISDLDSDTRIKAFVFAYLYQLNQYIPQEMRDATTKLASMLIQRKMMRYKLTILTAFAIRYALLDFDTGVALLSRFMKEDEEKIRHRLVQFIRKLLKVMYKHGINVLEFKGDIIAFRKKWIKQVLYESGLITKERVDILTRLIEEKHLNLGSQTLIVLIILLLLKYGKREKAEKMFSENKALLENVKAEPIGRVLVKFNSSGKMDFMPINYQTVRDVLKSDDSEIVSIRLRLA